MLSPGWAESPGRCPTLPIDRSESGTDRYPAESFPGRHRSFPCRIDSRRASIASSPAESTAPRPAFQGPSDSIVRVQRASFGQHLHVPARCRRQRPRDPLLRVPVHHFLPDDAAPVFRVLHRGISDISTDPTSTRLFPPMLLQPGHLQPDHPQQLPRHVQDSPATSRRQALEDKWKTRTGQTTFILDVATVPLM